MKQFFTGLLSLALLLTTGNYVSAQDKPLPEIKMPDIPYKPSIKKGWVGQFVYSLNFNDSTGTGKGKNRVYYHVIVNRLNSGFVELSNEVRGAIRKNQPDKNNVQRYECWINSGTKNTWSKHDEIDTVVLPTGLLGRDGITGRLEKFNRYTSDSNWVKGFLSNVDLQIDYETGKYSLAVPYVDYVVEGTETLVETVYSTGKKTSKINKDNKRHELRNFSYLTVGEWMMLEGDFKNGQQELIIRQRIPVSLEQFYNEKKLPVKKGFMEFYMVLKKVG
ncbi:MAG: hypothetical protein J0M10_09525 [Chitinophagales bacterium]|nr:hypothetical protein [Chitinophagales bacterium]